VKGYVRERGKLNFLFNLKRILSAQSTASQKSPTVGSLFGGCVAFLAD
jgi:hypothetical protein